MSWKKQSFPKENVMFIADNGRHFCTKSIWAESDMGGRHPPVDGSLWRGGQEEVIPKWIGKVNDIEMVKIAIRGEMVRRLQAQSTQTGHCTAGIRESSRQDCGANKQWRLR